MLSGSVGSKSWSSVSARVEGTASGSLLTSQTGLLDCDLPCFGKGTALDIGATGVADEEDLQQLPPPEEHAQAVMLSRIRVLK